MSKFVHEGYNLRRLREILHVDQSMLATMLGSDWTQKKVAHLEDKEQIDLQILHEVAAVLKVTPEAIAQFKDGTISIVSSSFHDHAGSVNYHCTFNPVDKIVELYEALVQSEREKTAIYKNQVDEAKK